MRRRDGFTLLEIMIVCAIMGSLFMIAGSAIVTVVRASRQDAALMEMDQEANQALGTLNRVLRRSILPVSLPDHPSGMLSHMGPEFAANGDAWRQILESGSTILPYVSPVDWDGDEDVMDQYGNPELGVVMPTGRAVPAVPPSELAEIKAGIKEKPDAFCPGIAQVNPSSQLGLSASGDVNLDTPAMAADFLFPNHGAQPIYGVVRFVPYRENGEPLILLESGLGQDFNEDGDLTDRFALGHLELNWPNGAVPNIGPAAITQYIGSDSMLLQINRNEDSHNAVFRLGNFSSTAAGAGLSIKTHLLLCNYLKQRDSWIFGGKMPFLTRTFQTVIKLRLMSIR
ncbi:MAG: prepilin-type N-terminal cleavage/methylation domain-containing protein [Planctomycetota bacterium]|nr:prepilin-type N-terminal cleavage/methylation domain-containing protein [Planctomycetota bacterium]